MSTLNIEKQIELEIIKLLEVETFVTTNNISVKSFRDNSEEREPWAIIVHCKPAKKEITGSPLWIAEVDLICMSYALDDSDMADLEIAYQGSLGFLNGLTKSTMTLTGITINGIEMNSGGEDIAIDENYTSRTANVLFHIQLT